jgi:hypothetical protein
VKRSPPHRRGEARPRRTKRNPWALISGFSLAPDGAKEARRSLNTPNARINFDERYVFD